MSRALHHHQAHHVPRRPSPNHHTFWSNILLRDGADWIAAALLLFGIGLIGYAIVDYSQSDTLPPAFTSRPSTYD